MLNEKVLYGTKKVLTKGQNFTLNYYVTKTQVNNKLIYGVAIDKLHNSHITEGEMVFNISDRYNTVREIINMLIKYSVTPVSMVNILDDLAPDIEDMYVLSKAV